MAHKKRKWTVDRDSMICERKQCLVGQHVWRQNINDIYRNGEWVTTSHACSECGSYKLDGETDADVTHRYATGEYRPAQVASN